MTERKGYYYQNSFAVRLYCDDIFEMDAYNRKFVIKVLTEEECTVFGLQFNDDVVRRVVCADTYYDEETQDLFMVFTVTALIYDEKALKIFERKWLRSMKKLERWNRGAQHFRYKKAYSNLKSHRYTTVSLTNGAMRFFEGANV